MGDHYPKFWCYNLKSGEQSGKENCNEWGIWDQLEPARVNGPHKDGLAPFNFSLPLILHFRMERSFQKSPPVCHMEKKKAFACQILKSALIIKIYISLLPFMGLLVQYFPHHPLFSTLPKFNCNIPWAHKDPDTI